MPDASKPLILASASPRRRAFLSQLGLRFDVDAADVDETVRPGENARDYVARVSQEKAEVVARRHPGAWVLAADTTVVLNGDILGKPSDAKEATLMLTRLSGHCHQVLSGVALRGPESASTVVETEVQFRELLPEEIAWYVATQEPFDKAGAYAIQGIGSFLVERISGSATNVVGLPLAETLRLLRQVGVPLPFGQPG
jgi:septum formation protein